MLADNFNFATINFTVSKQKVSGYTTLGKHIIIFFPMYKVNSKKDPNCRRETNSSIFWMAAQEENRIKINQQLYLSPYSKMESAEILRNTQCKSTFTDFCRKVTKV